MPASLAGGLGVGAGVEGEDSNLPSLARRAQISEGIRILSNAAGEAQTERTGLGGAWPGKDSDLPENNLKLCRGLGTRVPLKTVSCLITSSLPIRESLGHLPYDSKDSCENRCCLWSETTHPRQSCTSLLEPAAGLTSGIALPITSQAFFPRERK